MSCESPEFMGESLKGYQMDLEKCKYITGIKEFLLAFPDKPLYYFQDMLEFRRYIRFDYEEWGETTYIDLVMADETRRDGIVLHCVDAWMDGRCEIQTYIGGLDIIYLKDSGYEGKYRITDFEENNMNIYCNDLEIRVIDPGEYMYS